MLSEEHKLALARAIHEKKDILFGPLTPGITMKFRASVWMQIMGRLNALGACIEKVDDIRDTEWSYMKKKAKKHFKESTHTGSGASKMTAVDEAVMDTVGRNSANILGLQVPDCDISFAPRTLVSSADLCVYPPSPDVTIYEITSQDTAQAGPSGVQSNNSGNRF